MNLAVVIPDDPHFNVVNHVLVTEYKDINPVFFIIMIIKTY